MFEDWTQISLGNIERFGWWERLDLVRRTFHVVVVMVKWLWFVDWHGNWTHSSRGNYSRIFHLDHKGARWKGSERIRPDYSSQSFFGFLVFLFFWFFCTFFVMWWCCANWTLNWFVLIRIYMYVFCACVVFYLLKVELYVGI